MFCIFFIGFEQSPFKLTPEFVDVMGGTNSEHWREFNRLLLVGMMTARKHMDRIINFVEIMRSSKYSNYNILKNPIKPQTTYKF